MKLYFVKNSDTELADHNSALLSQTREELLKLEGIVETKHPSLADAILLQEANSYKDFRYIDKLLQDSLISGNTNKIYTINVDDCATGLLRGLYTCIPRSRFHPTIHACVPYMDFPNELVLSNFDKKSDPQFLASWRGNTKSNKIRTKMVNLFSANQDFQIETTNSWLNHDQDEKQTYVDIIKNAKYSLCPAGWAPASYRIYESMAMGKCPVIIADNFVPPKGPDWKSFALFFPEKEIYNLHSFLKSQEKQYKELGDRAYKAWNSFFNSSLINKYYASSLISLIKQSPRCSKENEIKRWKSLNLFWSNKWTVPQRIINKVRKLTEQ